MASSKLQPAGKNPPVSPDTLLDLQRAAVAGPRDWRVESHLAEDLASWGHTKEALKLLDNRHMTELQRSVVTLPRGDS